METVRDFMFLGSKITADGDYSLEIKRCLCLRRKAMTNLDSILKTFADKGFSNSHIWMWELDHKAEYRRIDAFELWCWRRLESCLDSKEIQWVHPKGNQSWIFIGRTDAEAETPILWPPDPKDWLIWKVPDAGKDWQWEEKGMTENEMVGWHHRLHGHELE